MKAASTKTLILLLFAVFIQAGCSFSKVNESISIKNGETVDHDLDSINGSISVGTDCTINGDCQTVNGSIEIGKNSNAGDLQSVNGGIRIDENVKIREDVTSVNGSVNVASNSKIDGSITTVNGRINVVHSQVKEDISTVNGDITLDNNAALDGSIFIKSKHSKSKDTLRIEILNGSVVKGDVKVEDEERKVSVYLENGGKVLGQITNAKVVQR